MRSRRSCERSGSVQSLAPSLFRSGLFVLALVLGGCGYKLQGGGSILPQDIKSIAIPMAENETSEPALDVQFTEALRSRFERYGVVRIVDSEAEADAVLTSKIMSAGSRVRNVTGTTDVAVQLELLMVVSATLKRKNGQILWRNNNVNATAQYANVGGLVVTSSPEFAQGGIGADSLSGLDSREVSRGQQAAAIDDATEEITRKIYMDAVAADF